MMLDYFPSFFLFRLYSKTPANYPLKCKILQSPGSLKIQEKKVIIIRDNYTINSQLSAWWLIMPKNHSSSIDIFDMLSDDSNEKKKSQRKELLSATGVKELFKQGDIKINKRTCQGLECKLCIDACPTNALFWQSGEIKIIKDLCV